MTPLSRRKHAHATGTKGFQQSAVFKLAHDAGPDAPLFEPQVQPISAGSVNRG